MLHNGDMQAYLSLSCEIKYLSACGTPMICVNHLCCSLQRMDKAAIPWQHPGLPLIFSCRFCSSSLQTKTAANGGIQESTAFLQQDAAVTSSEVNWSMFPIAPTQAIGTTNSHGTNRVAQGKGGGLDKNMVSTKNIYTMYLGLFSNRFDIDCLPTHHLAPPDKSYSNPPGRLTPVNRSRDPQESPLLPTPALANPRQAHGCSFPRFL